MADEDFTKDAVSNGSFVEAESEAAESNGTEHESDANKESSDLGEISNQKSI